MKKSENALSFLLGKYRHLWNLDYDYKKIARNAFLLFVTLFTFINFSFAQDLATNFSFFKVKSDASGKPNTLKKENREEKREIRRVENISSITQDLFAVDFPEAENVSWTAPEGFNEADFTLNGSKMMAFFDYSNELIGTGKMVDYNSLPVKALNYIALKYSDYTPEEVMFYDDNEENDNDMVFYGNSLDTDSYFVLMKKGDKEIVLQIATEGYVSYFSDFK